MIQALATAVQGKGFARLAQRTGSIIKSYGPGPQRMEKALWQFLAVLESSECQATFLRDEGHWLFLDHWPEIVAALVVG